MLNLAAALPLKEFGLVVAGGMITLIGYGAKRLIQRDKAKETLELHSKTLALHQGLKSEGLQIADLERIQSTFTARRKRTRQIEDEISKSFDLESTEGATPATSQRGMNKIAGASLRIAEAQLSGALVELELYIGDGQQLQATQANWAAYAESQARLFAESNRGGTIYSLIYCTELEHLTLLRTAELRAHTERLKTL